MDYRVINSHYIDFHNRYPNISVKFTTADTSVMFDMLDHNEADVIITLDSHSYHKDYIIAKEEPLSPLAQVPLRVEQLLCL